MADVDVSVKVKCAVLGAPGGSNPFDIFGWLGVTIGTPGVSYNIRQVARYIPGSGVSYLFEDATLTPLNGPWSVGTEYELRITADYSGGELVFRAWIDGAMEATYNAGEFAPGSHTVRAGMYTYIDRYGPSGNQWRYDDYARSQPADFGDDFNDGVLNPAWTLQQQPPNALATETSGYLQMSVSGDAGREYACQVWEDSTVVLQEEELADMVHMPHTGDRIMCYRESDALKAMVWRPGSTAAIVVVVEASGVAGSAGCDVLPDGRVLAVTTGGTQRVSATPWEQSSWQDWTAW